MTFQLGKLAQVIHVTDDLASARRLYRDVFAGEVYYEGYSAYEKRDASIYAIGDFSVEPMSPSDEEGALDFPIGRFLTRFGPRLHSVAINTKGVLELAQHLIANGVRVVGPGGMNVADLDPGVPPSIYTHPRDSHFLIEFVDFGPELMATSPRLAPDWDPSRWAEHPLGILGPSHVTTLVRDADEATTFFTSVLNTPLVAAPTDDASRRTARVRLGTETVIELLQPLDDASPEGQLLEKMGEGLYRFTLRIRDVDSAARHLESHGVAIAERTERDLVLDTASTAGAGIVLTTA